MSTHKVSGCPRLNKSTNHLTPSILMNDQIDFYFTNDQIDQLLRLVRHKAFQVKYKPQPEDDDEDYDYNELADLIEDQIVNHPINS